jgi:hypothetical protein
MENLDDRYDPDRWMASGKNLADFLSGGSEAELYYAAHPELGQRVARWRTIMADKVHKAHIELNERVSEEQLREIWRSVTLDEAP